MAAGLSGPGPAPGYIEPRAHHSRNEDDWQDPQIDRSNSGAVGLRTITGAALTMLDIQASVNFVLATMRDQTLSSVTRWSP